MDVQLGLGDLAKSVLTQMGTERQRVTSEGEYRKGRSESARKVQGRRKGVSGEKWRRLGRELRMRDGE